MNAISQSVFASSPVPRRVVFVGSKTGTITLEDVEAIASGAADVALHEDASARAARSEAMLVRMRLTDASLNKGLPPFLQGHATGLNSGFMGAQVTASALVAELRTKSAPASIQSVPTNANNQDVVTMGTIAARRAGDAVADVSRILAIQAMCVAQAMDLRMREDEAVAFSAAARAVHAFVREDVAYLHEDRPLSGEIETMAERMRDGDAMRSLCTWDAEVADALREF